MEAGKNLPLQSHLLPLIVLIVIPIISSPATLSSPEPTETSHFVLVHGACHGAWSWYKVSTILQSWGHNVTALDMAASGADQRQAQTLSAFSQYFEPLTEFMAALQSDERVVLVGHSFGGWGIARAMEAFMDKISVAVFVTAAMPGPSLSAYAIGIEEQKLPNEPLDNHFIYDIGEDKPPTGFILGPLKLAKHLYQLSPPEDLTLAKALVRPHPLLETNDSDFVFTTERYGVVKRAFVVTEKDLMSKREFQMWMIENNPPDIVVEIRGSDHMAMASKPLELAHQLQRIAHHFSLGADF